MRARNVVKETAIYNAIRLISRWCCSRECRIHFSVGVVVVTEGHECGLCAASILPLDPRISLLILNQDLPPSSASRASRFSSPQTLWLCTGNGQLITLCSGNKSWWRCVCCIELFILFNSRWISRLWKSAYSAEGLNNGVTFGFVNSYLLRVTTALKVPIECRAKLNCQIVFLQHLWTTVFRWVLSTLTNLYVTVGFRSSTHSKPFHRNTIGLEINWRLCFIDTLKLLIS